MEQTEPADRLRSEVFPDGGCAVLEDASVYRTSNPLLRDGRDPTRVVRPRDAEQLRGLVRLANEEGQNLVVVSSGGPHRRGGLSSGEEHVLVDLSGWKGLPWVNRRNRVCMIEPGVTYGELARALEPHGMTVSMPLAPRDTKSVLAAVMDREPSTWPNRQWDIGDPAGSTEFLFGSGETFRTGAAGGPGTLEEQRAAGGAQKCPEGPSQTDFFRVIQGAQGTMGIVTWITLRTEIRPSLEEPLLLGSDRPDPLVRFVYEVERSGLGEHAFLLDRTAAALLMQGTGRQSFEEVRNNLPRFLCLLNIAGFERLPEERVRYQKRDILDIARTEELIPVSSFRPVSARDLLHRAVHPCGETDWRDGLRGACLSVFFLSTLDRCAGLLHVMREAAVRHRVDPDRVGLYLQPVVQNHACHVEFLIPCDPGDREDVKRLRALEADAVPALSDAGAFFSRPYGAAQGVAFRKNPANLAMVRTVKGIFDPAGVLHRGKWGL